jgi:dTDP-4-dehydrorhamnose reductase
VVRSLLTAERPAGMDIVAVGRPELDLAHPTSVRHAIEAARPTVVVNAAAYTAVDKAESEPDLAFRVNAGGAEAVGLAAHALGVPVIHLSTDYVFDGTKPTSYVESDPVAPLGAYGRSKLEGERRLAAACPRHVILRTAWVHSPYGHNFTRTMLRLAGARPEISVVDDQLGCPTYAPHLARAIVQLAARLIGDRDAPWGTYHAAGTGTATWCGFAREIFAVSARLGGPSAAIKPITTAEYPTPARRPANSRLDSRRLATNFGLGLPDWREGVAACVAVLLAQEQGF